MELVDTLLNFLNPSVALLLALTIYVYKLDKKIEIVRKNLEWIEWFIKEGMVCHGSRGEQHN